MSWETAKGYRKRNRTGFIVRRAETINMHERWQEIERIYHAALERERNAAGAQAGIYSSLH